MWLKFVHLRVLRSFGAFPPQDQFHGPTRAAFNALPDEEVGRFAVSDGTPGVALMRNAGNATAAAACGDGAAGIPVVVLVGPGQNGGDGIVAATTPVRGPWL